MVEALRGEHQLTVLVWSPPSSQEITETASREQEHWRLRNAPGLKGGLEEEAPVEMIKEFREPNSLLRHWYP